MAEKNTALIKKDETAIATTAFKITADDVKKFFDKENKCSSTEVALFIKICQMNNLNPFKREVHLVKYGSNPMSIVTGYEVYLKRAEDSKNWGGFKCWTEGSVAKDDLKACIEIYRKDWDKPLYHEVHYSEYVGRKSDGSITKFWREKPITMLKKVAISQGFRFAFPEDLGGLPYTSDEMSNVDGSLLSNEPVGKPIVDEPRSKSEKTATVNLDKAVEINGETVLVSSEDVPDDLDMSAPKKENIFFDVEGKDGKIRKDAEGKLVKVISRVVGKTKKYDIVDYYIESGDQKVMISKFGKLDIAMKVGDVLHFYGVETAEYNGETQYKANDVEPISFGGDNDN